MDADLDDLLNDALSDFDKPTSSETVKTEDGQKSDSEKTTSDTKEKESPSGRAAAGGASLQPPTEIFEQFFDKDISQSLQREWESAMKELAEDDPNLAAHLQTLSSTLETATEASMAAGAGCSTSTSKPPSSEPVDLNKVMGATISGIGRSADELKNMSSAEAEEKFLQDFQNLGMGGNMADMMGQMGGMEGDFMSMMEGMMQNLLSKNVLYPTMKELSKVYPQWLDENKGKVPEGDFQRYKKQSNVIDKICKLFEEENDSDSKEVKSQRLNVMMDLVEQMQESGNPPKELLEKCGGETPVDMGKFFGTDIDPSAMFNQSDLQNPEQCSVM